MAPSWIHLLGVAVGLEWAACAGPPISHDVVREALIGKSKAAIVACAGPPLREGVMNNDPVLRYYREAPVLEESFFGSKSSVPRPHHGCWADLTIREDKIAAVRYYPVPDVIEGSEHCDEIFQHCAS